MLGNKNVRVRLSGNSPLIQTKAQFVIIRCESEDEAIKTMAQIRGSHTAAVTEQKETKPFPDTSKEVTNP